MFYKDSLLNLVSFEKFYNSTNVKEIFSTGSSDFMVILLLIRKSEMLIDMVKNDEQRRALINIKYALSKTSVYGLLKNIAMDYKNFFAENSILYVVLLDKKNSIKIRISGQVYFQKYTRNSKYYYQHHKVFNNIHLDENPKYKNFVDGIKIKVEINNRKITNTYDDIFLDSFVRILCIIRDRESEFENRMRDEEERLKLDTIYSTNISRK